MVKCRSQRSNDHLVAFQTVPTPWCHPNYRNRVRYEVKWKTTERTWNHTVDKSTILVLSLLREGSCYLVISIARAYSLATLDCLLCFDYSKRGFVIWLLSIHLTLTGKSHGIRSSAVETRVMKWAFPLLHIPQCLLLCAKFKWYFLYGTESINSMLMWLIWARQKRRLNLWLTENLSSHPWGNEMQKGILSIILPLVVASTQMQGGKGPCGQKLFPTE